MKFTPFMRACTAGAAAALLVLTTASAAHALPHATPAPAAPTPAIGPDSGSTPVTVTLPTGPSWVMVDPGRNHAVGLATDGLLYTWGTDTQGTITQLDTPDGVTFTDISVATNVSMALATDGTVYVWGTYPGDGSTQTVDTPTAVELPNDQIAAGIAAGRNFTLVRTTTGAVYGWGVNSEGALGTGPNTVSTYVPTLALIDPALTVTDITAGGEHALALASDADGNDVLLGWGNNQSYALGIQDSGLRNERTPLVLDVPEGTDIVDISAAHNDGSSSSHYVTADGMSFSVGSNAQFASGTGSADYELTHFTATHGFDYQTLLTEIEVGYDFGAGIGTDGALYSWGATPAALLLGNGAPERYVTPANTPANVTLSDLRLGVSSIAAIGDDGNAYIWGTNPGGETSSDATVIPAPAVTLTGVDFGGSAGTSPTQTSPTTWSILTPQHTTGVFNTTVNWAIGGAAQTPIVYQNGFTFTGMPTVRALSDVSGPAGTPLTLDLSVTGFPTPTIEWEVSFPASGGIQQRNSGIWQPITDDASAVVSPDGLTLTVTPGLGHHGARYQATATNEFGSATTNAATVMIAADNSGDSSADSNSGNGSGSNSGDATNNGSGNTGSGNNGATLPLTGGEGFLWVAGAVGLALLAAGTLLLGRRAAHKR